MEYFKITMEVNGIPVIWLLVKKSVDNDEVSEADIINGIKHINNNANEHGYVQQIQKLANNVGRKEILHEIQRIAYMYFAGIRPSGQIADTCAPFFPTVPTAKQEKYAIENLKMQPYTCPVQFALISFEEPDNVKAPDYIFRIDGNSVEIPYF